MKPPYGPYVVIWPLFYAPWAFVTLRGDCRA